MTMTLIPTFLSKPESAVNRTFLMLTVVALGACAKSETKVATIPTATIQRRDIVVNAEATGIIEPINVIEVKSKTASGQVTKMSIEIGTFVKPGDLIVQIDTTDLHTQFEQSKADLAAAGKWVVDVDVPDPADETADTATEPAPTRRRDPASRRSIPVDTEPAAFG